MVALAGDEARISVELERRCEYGKRVFQLARTARQQDFGAARQDVELNIARIARGAVPRAHARDSGGRDALRVPVGSLDTPSVVAAATVSGVVRFILYCIAGPFEVAAHAFDSVAATQQGEPCAQTPME